MAEPDRKEIPSGAQVVRRYQRRIYAVIHRMVGNRAEVEDLCQETFLQILRNPARLAAARDPDAWVHRVAMNVTVDFLRRKSRDRGLGENVAGRAPIPGPSAPPEDDAASAARLALDRLSPLLRQVVVLRVFEGLSHEQIAAATDASVGTVRWRLFEARRQLAEFLGPRLDDLRKGTP